MATGKGADVAAPRRVVTPAPRPRTALADPREFGAALAGKTRPTTLPPRGTRPKPAPRSANPYDDPLITGKATETRAGVAAKPAANPYDTPAIRGTGKAGVSPVTGRVVTPARQQLAAAAKAGDTSGFLGRLGGNLVDITAGLPAFGGLIGKVIASPFAAAYGWAPGDLPGAGAAREFASGVAGKGGSAEQFTRAVGSDFATRYGPTASALGRGDVLGAGRELGKAAWKDPGFVGLDIASGFSGAGAAVGAAGRLAARAAPASRAGQIGARVGDRSLAARARPERTVTSRVAEDVEGGASRTFALPQTYRSRNPITRAVQKHAIDPALGKARESITGFAERIQPEPGMARTPTQSAARLITEESRAQRRAGKVGGGIRLGGEEQLLANTADLVQAYAKATEKLKPIMPPRPLGALRPVKPGLVEHFPHEQDVVHLGIRGILDQPDLSGRAALNRALDVMQENLDLAKGRKERGTTVAQRQINRMRAIPDEYLDYATMPAHIRTAIDEGKTLVDETQRRAVDKGYISEETAAGSRDRAVNILLRGSKWDKRVINLSEAAQQSLGKVMRTGEEQARILRTREPGVIHPTQLEAERIGRTAEGAADARVQRDISRRFAGLTSQGRVERGGAGVGIGTYGRKAVLLDRARGAAVQAGEAPRRRRLRELRGERREALAQFRRESSGGGFTPPRSMEPGPARLLPENAGNRYITDYANTPMGQRPSFGASGGRITQPKIQRSHGKLVSEGRFSTAKELPALATRRVLAYEQLSDNVAKLIQQTAYLDEAGKRVSGPKARLMMEADPDRVVLISERSLEHAMDRLQHLDEGKGLPEESMEGLFYDIKKPPDDARLAQSPDDFIAIPKGAMQEWKGAMSNPNSVVKGLDSVMDLWKGGILAFAPRWYLNNTLGNTMQFGLLAAGDLRTMTSLRQARRASFLRRGVIPEEVARTVAQEIGMSEKAIGNIESLPRTKKWMRKGYQINNAMETFWRRAGYISASRQLLRDEGVKMRGMTDLELADRMAAMSPELKRQAVKLTQRFLGDYRNFNKFERNVIKRFIPFYSWMRFISTLTLTLPIKHPLRAEALRVMSEANDVENPDDFMRPLYNRGRLNLGPNYAMRTTGAVPFRSVEGLAAALTGGGDRATGLAQALAGSGLGPIPQIALGELTGIDPFTGLPFSAHPGAQGTAAMFGSDPMRRNQATGRPETVRITPGFLEQALQSMPGVPQLRQILAGDQIPYDTTTMRSLIERALGGGPPVEEMFRPPAKTGRAVTPLPYGLSPISGFAGLPIQNIDRQVEATQYAQAEARYQQARAAMQAARMRARAKLP